MVVSAMKIKDSLEKEQSRDLEFDSSYKEWFENFIKPLNSDEINDLNKSKKKDKCKSLKNSFSLISFKCNNSRYKPIQPLLGA